MPPAGAEATLRGPVLPIRCLGRGVRFAALGLAIGAATGTAAETAEPDARSGIYDTLTVAVVDGAVRGAFVDQRGRPEPGGAPPFSCVFLLRGRLEGAAARIVVWTPGDRRTIVGELRFRADGAVLRLDAEPDGCGMTSGDMVGEPYETTRRSAGATGDWRDVRVVAAARAVLHREPGRPGPRAPYVTALDPVVILERRAEWVRALYLGGARPVTGWLRLSDLAPADPPAAR